MIDVERTIVSQFANSPTIRALVRDMNEWVDPRSDLQTFYDYVWNIATAQGFGLDTWGKIVGIGREIPIDADPDHFGFETGVADTQPFDQAPFWSGDHLTSIFRLADSPYRKMILAKAMANITRCTAPAINRMLQNLFADRGKAYVNDLGGMTMRYVFYFKLAPYEITILNRHDVLPRPAGVLLQPLTIVVEPFLGFDGMGGPAVGFDQAPFFQGA